MATAFAFIVAGTGQSTAQKSTVLKRIKERGVINMGHREASVPFAFIGSGGKVQGYSIDLCDKFVEKIKKTLKMSDIKVKHVPVTSQTRLALIANGTIDMECGSTTNNLTRQKQVDYLPVTFITGTKLASSTSNISGKASRTHSAASLDTDTPCAAKRAAIFGAYLVEEVVGELEQW